MTNTRERHQNETDMLGAANKRVEVLESALRTIMELAGQMPIAAMHRELLRQVDGLMDAKAGTPEAAQLLRLVTIVEAYETIAFPIDASPKTLDKGVVEPSPRTTTNSLKSKEF